MLTKHQTDHLEAAIQDTIRHSASTVGTDVANEMAKYHDVDTRDYQDYLDAIRAEAQVILGSDTWPKAVVNDYDIHDYLEVNKSFRPFEGELNG